MKRRFTILTAALALLACLAIPMGMWGQTRSEVTYTFSQHYSSDTELVNVAISIDNAITATFTKGEGSTAPKYYTNGTAVRWYAKNTLAVAASNATITGIEITYTRHDNSVTANVGEYSDINGSSGTGTWTGSASSVTFTEGGSSGHDRITAIKVTYTGSTTPSLSVDPASINFGEVAINTSHQETFTVTYENLTEDLSITGFTGVTVSPATIEVGEGSGEATVTVTYAPTTEGTLGGNITVSNTDDEVSETVAVSGSAYDPSNVVTYERYTGAIVEGDYIICANEEVAMKNVISSSRFANAAVTVTDNKISNPDASIIWHIAPDGDHWTIYNAAVNKYAAGTNSNNQGTLLDAVTDNARWDITYQYSNYTVICYGRNSSNNKYLRRNGDYGWATYANGTGNVPTFYKKVITNQVAAPTFSPVAGTYNEAQSVTLSCETVGATIYYTIDGTTPSASNGTEYTSTAIAVSTTTTIKAIAVKDGMADSDVATAIYTIVAPLTTMDEIFAATATPGDYPITFNNWIVTGVGSNAKRAFVTDGTKGFIIYNSDGDLTFESGQVLSGTIVCQVQLLNGAPCVTGINASDFDITQTGVVPTVTSTTIDALSAVNTGAVVDLGQLTWNGSTFEDGNENEIYYYNTIYSTSFTANKEYTVKGVFVYYNGNSNPKEIAPRDANDIVEVVITDPYITIESDEFELTANEEEGYLEITYGNLPEEYSFDIQCYDAEGNELDECVDWLGLAIEAPEEEEGDFVYYFASANQGSARTAYFKVYASWLIEIDGDVEIESVYSNLVTVTQAEFVPDYVVLPFNWEGGTKEELTALNGVTGFGLGSNYAETNAPYRVRFDNQGDYILVKTDSQPGKVTIGIKNFGSSTGTIIAVQESSNGSDFTEVEELTITCSQNKTQEFETSNSFNASSRYVRLYDKTHNSNFGVGPITIAKPIQKTLIANQWYLISSPVGTINLGTSQQPTNNVGNLTTGTYGLYSFDQTGGGENGDGKEWRNYKAGAFSQLEAGKGYLYINQGGCTLTFTGTAYSTPDGSATFPIDYYTSNPTTSFHGLNLVGNPFNEDAAINLLFYKMNATTGEIEAASGLVHPMEGVFVVASENVNSVTFQTGIGYGGGDEKFSLNLTQNRGNVIDRAIVRFDEGGQLPKVQLFENSTKIYISQNGKDYAVVRSEGQGELPVNFRASENGTYTLSMDVENMDMNYLHLIDNMTGMDVDLLQTPSYTFEAKVNDYESRFRLVFAANNEDGVSTGSTAFAFYSNGSWIINNAGEATLQVVDLTGRILSSETVNGSVSKTINAVPGIYMLRLINGDNVNVQKIVVR